MQTNATPGATASTPFFPYNYAKDNLFTVRPGVPLAAALRTASVFLDEALDAARNLADSCDDNSAIAVDHLITFAKALVDSVILGDEAKPGESKPQQEGGAA